MITGKLRSDIDKLWEEFWTGGITFFRKLNGSTTFSQTFDPSRVHSA